MCILQFRLPRLYKRILMRCKQKNRRKDSRRIAWSASLATNASDRGFAALRQAAVGLGLAMIALTATAQQPTSEGSEFFENRIRPPLVEHCLDCHTGDEPESGLSMDSLAGLLKGGLRGPAIVIGKPEASLLIRALRHGEVLKMPPKEKLSSRLISYRSR